MKKLSKLSQAGILVTIITIVMSIAAVVLFWNFYQFIIKDKVADIGIDSLMVDGEIEYWLPNDIAVVKIKRGTSDVNVSGIKIIFNGNDGINYINETNQYPKPLETKKYLIYPDQLAPGVPSGWNFGKVNSISFYYVFPDKKISREVDKKEINRNANVSTKFGDACLYQDVDGDGYGTGTTGQCVNPASAGKKSTENNDCDDDPDHAGETIYPGAVEVCNDVDDDCDELVDDGVSGCLRNYQVTPVTLGSLFISDSTCTSAGGSWTTISTFDGTINKVTLPFSFNYYITPSINQITICQRGHLLLGGSCFAGGPTTSPSLLDLKNGKISPYMTRGSSSITSVKYCTTTTYAVFDWTDSNNNVAQAVIHKDSNNVEFSYGRVGSLLSSETGISNNNIVSYFNEIFAYNGAITVNNDYSLTYV